MIIEWLVKRRGRADDTEGLVKLAIEHLNRMTPTIWLVKLGVVLVKSRGHVDQTFDQLGVLDNLK